MAVFFFFFNCDGKLAVSRGLCSFWFERERPSPYLSDNHLSRPSIAEQLKRPTRTRLGLRLQHEAAASSSVLLRMGFTSRVVTNAARGLLHHGSTLACACLAAGHRRSISVALSFSSR